MKARWRWLLEMAAVVVLSLPGAHAQPVDLKKLAESMQKGGYVIVTHFASASLHKLF